MALKNYKQTAEVHQNNKSNNNVLENKIQISDLVDGKNEAETKPTNSKPKATKSKKNFFKNLSRKFVGKILVRM